MFRAASSLLGNYLGRSALGKTAHFISPQLLLDYNSSFRGEPYVITSIFIDISTGVVIVQVASSKFSFEICDCTSLGQLARLPGPGIISIMLRGLCIQ